MTRGETTNDDDITRLTANPPRWWSLWPDLKEIWEYRELIGHLVRRQVRTRYTGSVMGTIWSIQFPLIQLLVYWLVMGKFLQGDAVPYFGLFIFSGIVVITLMTEVLSTAAGAIVNSAGLVKKVYLPREVFPLSMIGGALVNFLYSLGVLAVGTILAGFLSGVWPDPGRLWLPVFGTLVLLTFCTAVGLAASAANVFHRDIEHFIRLGMILWFWITPVLYSVDHVTKALPAWLADIYLANPAAPVVYAFRETFWPQGNKDAAGDFDHLELRLVITFGVSLVLLWIAQRYFRRTQVRFAEAM